MKSLINSLASLKQRSKTKLQVSEIHQDVNRIQQEKKRIWSRNCISNRKLDKTTTKNIKNQKPFQIWDSKRLINLEWTRSEYQKHLKRPKNNKKDNTVFNFLRFKAYCKFFGKNVFPLPGL